MNAVEVNVFLTKAALVDPRMKRVDPMDQADMATQWAELLDDVPLEAAVQALRTHYRASSDPITPARVVDLAGIGPAPAFPDLTAEYEAESRRLGLERLGVSEEEFARRSGDRAWLVGLQARWEALAIEAQR